MDEKMIKEVFEEFMDSRERRLSTVKLYRYTFRLLIESIGDENITMGEIKPSKISDFIDYLSSKHSSNSIYIIYCIVKSLFRFAENHYYIKMNPCKQVDTRSKITRRHHHQALSEKQMSACEKDFWKDFNSGVINKGNNDANSLFFAKLCFIMGYYMQGLALIDLLQLKVSQARLQVIDNEEVFVIDTQRRKTAKNVKIVIPESHSRRYLLFKTMHDKALSKSRQHIFDFMDDIADEQSLYKTLNSICCGINRQLKRWWKHLNKTSLHGNHIDTSLTSYYSCRHTFATLYLQNPAANLSELASLMGRNTEYIDMYVKEIESTKTIAKANDKVFASKGRKPYSKEQKEILDNQHRIIEMQKLILERLAIPANMFV